jgi:hypothetical protein
MLSPEKKQQPQVGDPDIPAIRLERKDSIISTFEDDNEIPWLEFRWMHGGAQYMNLPTAPITSQATNYVAFSTSENHRLEEAYQKLSDEEKKEAGQASGKGMSEETDKSKKKEGDTANERNGKTAKKERDSAADQLKIEKADSRVELEVGDVGPDDVDDHEQYPDPGNEMPTLRKDRKEKEEKDKQEEDLDTVVGVTVSQVSIRDCHPLSFV